MKRQVNIRLSDYERRQVKDLIKLGVGINTTEVIQRALDRLHQQMLTGTIQEFDGPASWDTEDKMLLIDMIKAYISRAETSI